MSPRFARWRRAVGFHYNYIPETKQFAHATGIIVLTPQGKVSRYFYGIQYPSRDIRLALVEASNEKIGNPVDAVLLYCCQYDPTTGKYSMVVSRILRIAGAITLLSMGTLIFALSRGGRQKSIQDSRFSRLRTWILICVNYWMSGRESDRIADFGLNNDFEQVLD